jgi:hypothetical protein
VVSSIVPQTFGSFAGAVPDAFRGAYFHAGAALDATVDVRRHGFAFLQVIYFSRAGIYTLGVSRTGIIVDPDGYFVVCPGLDIHGRLLPEGQIGIFFLLVSDSTNGWCRRP